MSVCYLDLDGVVCDFVRGALRHHGREDITFDTVRWGIEAQLGFSSPEGFWRDLGFGFWSSLGWTKEGKRLLSRLENIFGDNIVILTSPCKTAGGVEGKVAWIAREMPKYARRFCVSPAKHLMAAPGKVLVDDHDANCDKFEEYGGAAVLVPRPWNRRRGECLPGGLYDPAEVQAEALASSGLVEGAV